MNLLSQMAGAGYLTTDVVRRIRDDIADRVHALIDELLPAT